MVEKKIRAAVACYSIGKTMNLDQWVQNSTIWDTSGREREQGKGLEWRADHKYWQFLHQAPHSASSSHNGMHSPEMEDIEFCRWFSLLNWFALDLMALKVCSKKDFCEKVGIQFWSKVWRGGLGWLIAGVQSWAISRENPQPSFVPLNNICAITWKYTTNAWKQ